MRYFTINALRASVLALGGAVLTTAGCGDSHELCPELCERSSECPEVIGDEETCTSNCTSKQEEAEEKGCEEQWEAYSECESHSTNLCDPQMLAEECSVQLDAYNACTQ
jgi:hypothetical protein